MLVAVVSSLALAQDVTEIPLSEALDRLGTANPDLLVAESRARAASSFSRQAAAAFLPIVAASGSYTRNNAEVVFDFGGFFTPFAPLLDPLGVTIPPIEPVVIQPLEVWNAVGSVQVPLFAPSAWSDWTAARHGADAARAGVAEAKLQLEAGLVTVAASVEAAGGLVAAAERAAEVAEAHLASTRVAEAAGTATAVDVLAAQADLAKQRSAVLQARGALAQAEDQVGALLGMDGPARIVLPEGEAPAPSSAPLPALDLADASVAAARSQVRSALWRHAPTVSATAAALAATQPFPTGEDTAWQVGVEATWVLFDGGYRYGKLDQAHADLAAAEAQREGARRKADVELRDATRDLELAREQVALAEEQSRLAAEAARIAGLGLAAGTTSPLQARDVEAQAFQADVGVAAARAQLRIAEATMRRTSGQGQRW